MTSKPFSAALTALVLVVAVSTAQAAVHRSHHTVSPARAGYQVDDPPWTFACIKDHGTSRCNDLN